MKSMGLTPPDPLPAEGWFVGYRVNDPQIWADVKSGKLAGFSIGGSGTRIRLEH